MRIGSDANVKDFLAGEIDSLDNLGHLAPAARRQKAFAKIHFAPLGEVIGVFVLFVHDDLRHRIPNRFTPL